MSVRRWRSTRRRAGWAAGLVVATVVVLAGCGLISAMVNTDRALRNAGFSSVSVRPVVGSGSPDIVDVSVTVNAPPGEGEARQVARIVWSNLREHFDALQVTVHGHGPQLRQRYTFAELVGLFGARNQAYDRTTISSSATSLGEDVLIGFAVGVVVVAGIVVAIIVVVRRHRRPPGPPWPGPAGPGGHQQGPAGPGGHQQGPGGPWSAPGWGGAGGPPPSGPAPGWPSPPSEPSPGGRWGDPAPPT